METEGGILVPASDLRRQLRGDRLATAEILYRLPDHPSLLQSYLWQDLDRLPEFPVLRRFLAFWRERLDGRLYRVRVAAVPHITEGKWRAQAIEIPVD